MAFSENNDKTPQSSSINNLVFAPVHYTETPQIRDDSFIRLTMPAGQQLIGTTQISTNVYSAMLCLGQNVGVLSEQKALPHYISALLYGEMLKKGNGLPEDHPQQEHVTQRFRELLAIVDIQAQNIIPKRTRLLIRRKIKTMVSPG